MTYIMQFTLSIALLLVTSIGCSTPTYPYSRQLAPPQETNPQNEFVLPFGIDDVQAAVVSVYARLMLPVEALSTKDGANFRLINSNSVPLSHDLKKSLADCGREEVSEYKKGWRRGSDYKFVVVPVGVTIIRPIHADLMSFNVVILKRSQHQSVIRIETSFSRNDGAVCYSSGEWEKTLYTNTLAELVSQP